MCLYHQIEKKHQFHPMLHAHHTKLQGIKKRVSFSAKHTIHLYLSAPQGHTFDAPCIHNRMKDPLPKGRRVQQLIARRAVLSFQRHIRESHIKTVNQDDQRRLADMSVKFSQRAKEVAMENARVNYLEVYDDDSSKRPRFSTSHSVNADVPIQVSEFPQVKLTKRVS